MANNYYKVIKMFELYDSHEIIMRITFLSQQGTSPIIVSSGSQADAGLPKTGHFIVYGENDPVAANERHIKYRIAQLISQLKRLDL